ncbi:PHP domain-containing protein [Permianibacter aggregans]|nr:PHP domain-containing protein [Permianibacter aggregans]
MFVIIDLHCHSHYSDGALSPAELVQQAESRGVNVLALSDHDSVDGIAEAKAAAQSLKLVPAVELSCGWQHKEIHVVGLGVDTASTVLQQGLATQQQRRWHRAEAICAKLAKDNINGVLEQLCSRQASAPTRSHVAHELVDRGLVKDQERAFKRYLGRTGSAYVPAEWCSLSEGISWIREAGGIPVLAHPGRYKLSGSGLQKLTEAFKEAGGQGFELSYPQLFPKEAQRMAKLVRSLELWASQGSDFHSEAQRWTGLGRMPPLPPAVTTVWQARPELFS